MHIFLVFSFFLCTFAPLNEENCCCSSVVEHFLGKEEVTSSSLVNSSGKEEPWLFLFCILTQAITLLRSHPCSNKKRQHSRTATHPPRCIERFILPKYSVESNRVHFNSSPCTRFQGETIQSQNGLGTHYKRVLVTLYISMGNFSFRLKSK